jgi:hypothetical protein
MAWLETDRHGRLRIAFKYYDGRTYRQIGHRNLTMLIRHYWRWINPGELSQATLARLGATKRSSKQPHPDTTRANQGVSREARRRCSMPKSAAICREEGIRTLGPVTQYARFNNVAAVCEPSLSSKTDRDSTSRDEIRAGMSRGARSVRLSFAETIQSGKLPQPWPHLRRTTQWKSR